MGEKVNRRLWRIWSCYLVIRKPSHTLGTVRVGMVEVVVGSIIVVSHKR